MSSTLLYGVMAQDIAMQFVDERERERETDGMKKIMIVLGKKSYQSSHAYILNPKNLFR